MGRDDRLATHLSGCWVQNRRGVVLHQFWSTRLPSTTLLFWNRSTTTVCTVRPRSDGIEELDRETVLNVKAMDERMNECRSRAWLVDGLHVEFSVVPAVGNGGDVVPGRSKPPLQCR